MLLLFVSQPNRSVPRHPSALMPWCTCGSQAGVLVFILFPAWASFGFFGLCCPLMPMS